MQKDISKGIAHADLKACDIEKCHNSFCSDRRINHVQTVFCNRIMQGGHRNFINQQDDSCIFNYYSPDNAVLFNHNNDDGELFVKDLCSYSLKNPNQPGSVGLAFDFTEAHNYLISSGLLSGCSFAVLKSGNRIIVIHAGAVNDNNNMPDPRGLYKNADLLCMANYLAGHQLLNNLSQMDIVQMVELLNSFNYRGFVFYKSDMSKVAIKTSNVTGYSYSMVNLNYPFADVVCLINKVGKMQIALRPLSGIRKVSKTYKLWSTQL